MEHSDEDLADPRRWKKNGWIARVIKNEGDEGWAVEMSRVGDPEPTLVGPWTMGRDKKNPKPLDEHAFTTLIKTATEVMRRHQHAARERMHRSISFTGEQGQRLRADLDIAPDEDDPHAILALFDEASGEQLRSRQVSAAFKLTATSARRFLDTGEG